jgi:hypothetical protein
MDLGDQLQTTFFFLFKKFNLFNVVYGNTSSSLSESREIHRKITVQNAAFSMLPIHDGKCSNHWNWKG